MKAAMQSNADLLKLIERYRLDIGDPREEIRALAVSVLKEISVCEVHESLKVKAVDSLLVALKSSDYGIKKEAVAALGEVVKSVKSERLVVKIINEVAMGIASNNFEGIDIQQILWGVSKSRISPEVKIYLTRELSVCRKRGIESRMKEPTEELFADS